MLGIFIVLFEMNSALPNSSCLIGYKCTNEDCLRIFPNRGMLLRTSSTKVPTAQTRSSQERCIKSTTIELTTFNPQGLYIVRFPVMSSTLRQLCATISAQYHAYQQYNAYKYVHWNKKTIVNIFKSSVKHNKTYWSKLWFRSDTHLILL